MELNDFNYNLPQQLIAQEPCQPRDHARLLVYDRKLGKTKHDFFYNLTNFLSANDVLVFNNTKVFPARLIGYKDSGGKIEIFLLKKIKYNIWQVLVGGKRKQQGTKIFFNKKLLGTLLKHNPDNTWEIKFNLTGKKFWQVLNKIGQTPLPPYIKKNAKLSDYQTIYAKKIGSVAAPTAGFHFTKNLLYKLIKQGVQIEYITLHVGLGTFAPIKTKYISRHHLHAEWVKIDKNTANQLNHAKQQGKRIIAVGTTTVRTLEALTNNNGRIKPANKWINIFIYPGFKFKFIDGLITNFHLPQSSLLMLVAAFLTKAKNKRLGINKLHKIYNLAIKKKYRFYSFGDGMYIK